jgi:hypothetical protein
VDVVSVDRQAREQFPLKKPLKACFPVLFPKITETVRAVVPV